ncbi:hypothetical protein [Jeotgalibacillus proteolyticus]
MEHEIKAIPIIRMRGAGKTATLAGCDGMLSPYGQRPNEGERTDQRA